MSEKAAPVYTARLHRLEPTVTRGARILTTLCWLVGLVYLLVFLGIAFSRIGFGFELEWMEGGMVSHGARLMSGHGIYGPPSADFVPFFYTPGYPAILAALGTLVGDLTLPMARIVSLCATLGTFGLLYRIGQREADWRFGLLAMGIYAALFRTNGAFYDLARPDALFIGLVLAGVYVAYYRDSVWGALGAGAIFAVAFFTKQTASVFVPAVGVFLLWRNWRHGLVFLGVAFGLTSMGVWAVNRATEGWFWTFIFEGHQGHLFYWKNILMEYWRDLLFVAPILLLLPLAWFGYKVPIPLLSLFLLAHWTYAFVFRATTLDYVPHMYYRELFYEDPRWLILIPPALIAALLVTYRARTPNVVAHTGAFWLLMYVAGVGSSGLNHSTQWAYSNCFMPASVFAAILIPLALRDLTAERRPWSALVPAALLVQFVAWGYAPSAQVPGAEDDAALADFEASLAPIEGKVLAPAHPLFTWRRDGVVHVHQMGIQDVAFMGGLKDFNKRLRKKEWAAVVVDERNRVPGLRGAYYQGDRMIYSSPDALRAKTGFLVRPSVIWYAQDPEPRALAGAVSGNFEGESVSGWTATGKAFATPLSGRHVRGRQGRRAVQSTTKGTGRYVSDPFTLDGGRLTFLVAGRGRVGVRLEVNGKVVARVAPIRQKRLELRREVVDVTPWRGQQGVLHVFDDDPKGKIAFDDVRLGAVSGSGSFAADNSP